METYGPSETSSGSVLRFQILLYPAAQADTSDSGIMYNVSPIVDCLRVWVFVFRAPERSYWAPTTFFPTSLEMSFSKYALLKTIHTFSNIYT